MADFHYVIDNLGKYLFKIVFYNGGESLIHKDAYRMIRHAYENSPADIDITTNMSFKVTDKDMATLAECCNTVNVCLDGVTQETHEKNRVGGSFEKAYNNMLRLKGIVDDIGGRCTVGWNFIPFLHNEREIEAAMKMAEEAGVYFVLVPPLVTDYSWLPSNPIFWRSHSSNRKGQQFKEVEIDCQDNETTMEAMTRSLAAGYEDGAQPCSMLYGATVINWDLSMVPCCNAQEGIIEMARTADFLDTYNGEKYSRLRENGCATCTKSLFRDQNGTVDACALDLLKGILPRLDQFRSNVRAEFQRYSEGQFLDILSRGTYKGYIFTKYMTLAKGRYPFIDDLGSFSPAENLFLAAAAIAAETALSAARVLIDTEPADFDFPALSVASHAFSILAFLVIEEFLVKEGTPSERAMSFLSIAPRILQEIPQLKEDSAGLQKGHEVLMDMQSSSGPRTDQIRKKLQDALLTAGKMSVLSRQWKAPDRQASLSILKELTAYAGERHSSARPLSVTR